jgi:hypothetical protein
VPCMICMVRQAQKLQYSCAWEAIKKIKKRLDNLMTGRTKRSESGVFLVNPILPDTPRMRDFVRPTV